MLKSAKDLKKGDVIIGQGMHPAYMHELPTRANGGVPIEVTEFIEHREDGTTVVKVKQPEQWITDRIRYVKLTYVEVARWATIAGKRFLKVNDDLYMSPDRRWTIERDDMESECDGPHPVKLTRELIGYIESVPDQYPHEAVEAVKEMRGVYGRNYTRRKGYMCPGNEFHTHKEWVPHDNETPGFDHMGSWARTPSDAISAFIDQVY
jgi:hypothetical protein